MPPLRVPDDGLLLSGSPGDEKSFPSQAFAITLSDDVIEDLVKCFQNGEGIQLSLGSSPVGATFPALTMASILCCVGKPAIGQSYCYCWRSFSAILLPMDIRVCLFAWGG